MANDVVNTDATKAIIIVCSKLKPTSYIDSATPPPTSGPKKETPKFPRTRAADFLALNTISGVCYFKKKNKKRGN